MEIRDKITKSNYERSLTQLSHNLQMYISLTQQWTLKKLCKKRYHSMVDLQPFLSKTLKQDSSRHQVWNIDKLYTRKNLCIKREKKQHMWDKGEENIHHHISKNTMYVKSGHKTMVHEVRKDTPKPHYIPHKHSPLI